MGLALFGIPTLTDGVGPRFRWFSAAAHLSGSDTSHLLDMAFWQQSGGTQNWQELL